MRRARPWRGCILGPLSLACASAAQQAATPTTPSPVAATEAHPGNPTGPREGAVFTELGEIVLSQDLDVQFPEALRLGEGGGLDLAVMFSEHFQPNLHECAKAVRDVSNRWATAHRLAVAAEEVSPKRVLLHYVSSTPPGFFEVVYRVYPEYRSAHAYFGFYDDAMRRLSPTSIESMIKDYALGPFVDDLRKAAECNQGLPVR